jgi:hypothetical protein
MRKKALVVVGLVLASALGSVPLVVTATAAATPARRITDKHWRRLPPPSLAARVTLESASGAPLRSFQSGGQTWVLGELGERYAIRVHNPTGSRIEAVVSVDGRDVLSGNNGDFRAQRGYLVPPQGSVLITGFRRSLDEVAAFRFSDRDESYSARRGTPQNVGVIGVAIFAERAEPVAVAPAPGWGGPRRMAPRPAEAKRDRAAGAAESAPSQLGTGWGETRESRVVEVPFRRATPNHPQRLLQLRYDDAAGLEARGIEVFPRAWRGSSPPSESRGVDPWPAAQRRWAPPPPVR